MTNLILPAAGVASRMGGIPKFLLPTGVDGETLISRWITFGLDFVDRIVIPTNKLFFPLVKELYSGTNLEIIEVTSKSMAETIKKVCLDGDSIVAMPDTYISEIEYFLQTSIQKLETRDYLCSVATWKIEKHHKGKVGQVLINDGLIKQVIDKDPFCDYPDFWGAVSFTKEFLDHIKLDDAHLGVSINRALGYKIKINSYSIGGIYNDCGTINEYSNLILRNNLP